MHLIYLKFQNNTIKIHLVKYNSNIMGVSTGIANITKNGFKQTFATIVKHTLAVCIVSGLCLKYF